MNRLGNRVFGLSVLSVSRTWFLCAVVTVFGCGSRYRETEGSRVVLHGRGESSFAFFSFPSTIAMLLRTFIDGDVEAKVVGTTSDPP